MRPNIENIQRINNNQKEFVKDKKKKIMLSEKIFYKKSLHNKKKLNIYRENQVFEKYKYIIVFLEKNIPTIDLWLWVMYFLSSKSIKMSAITIRNSLFFQNYFIYNQSISKKLIQKYRNELQLYKVFLKTSILYTLVFTQTVEQ